ncbi:hypothetical protein [Galbibacter orientalis]|uniref:hypothetical protein n=1 Tax=Galbibacter orientalis TaxID=453852 RepID=UPI003003693C
MKNRILVLSLIFFSLKGYCQTANDSIKLPSLNSFYLSSSKLDFNEFNYSYNLKKQLIPYILKVDGINADNVYPISFKNYFFKDYYDIYNDNLERFIPKPPDITTHLIPFE